MLLVAAVLAACGPQRAPGELELPCDGACPAAVDGGVGHVDAGFADAGPCVADETNCGGVCVDTTTDSTHCHSCGTVCTLGQICAASGCLTLPQVCPADGCPAGSYCDATTNMCVGGCVTDSSCDTGQICVANHCIAGCDGNRPCATGNVCDQNHCRPACGSDADCPLDSICDPRTQMCTSGCDADARCQDGEVCDTGQCRVGCRADSECATGEICDASSRTCTTGCRADSACGTGQICDATSSLCVTGCRTDGACGTGQICVSLSCRAGCRQDSDCGASGMICPTDTLMCRAGCRQDSDCPLQKYCTASLVCASGCDNDSSRCPVGESCVGPFGGTTSCSAQGCADSFPFTCSGDNFTCYQVNGNPASRCRQTCTDDTDCPGGYVCSWFTTYPALADEGDNSLSLCARPCTSNGDCSSSVPGVSPVPPCGCYSGQCAWGSDTIIDYCYRTDVASGL